MAAFLGEVEHVRLGDVEGPEERLVVEELAEAGRLGVERDLQRHAAHRGRLLRVQVRRARHQLAQARRHRRLAVVPEG